MELTATTALAKMMRQRGIGFRDLAERADIPVATLHRATTGRVQLRGPRLQRVARVLDVAMEDLVDAEAPATEHAKAAS